MSNSQSRDVFACDGAVSAGTASPGTAAASGLKLVDRQKHQSAQQQAVSVALRCVVCSVSVRGDFPQLAAVIRKQGCCREDA